MKFTYYANLIPGLQDTAGEMVKSCLKDSAIKKSLEGALIFETACPVERWNLFCFNNVFRVRDFFQGEDGNRGIEAHIRRLCRQKTMGTAGPVDRGIRTFRIVCSRANQLVSINENLKRNAEALISRQTGLIPCRANPDREYWFLYRTEGFSLFMERLTRHRPFDKTLHPGELTPQLAYIMCWMAGLKKTDTALDPFCGYGAIPAQGIGHFSPEKMYALDSKAEAVKITRQKINALAVKGGAGNGCVIKQMDIRSVFSLLPAGSVDRIITDPPWGIFERADLPLEEFYGEMAGIFYRLLKDGGLAVLLTAGKDEFTAAVSRTPGLEITGLVHILVSGKKAGIFTVRKTGGPVSNSKLDP